MRSIAINVNDKFSIKVTEEGVQLILVGVGAVALTHEEFDRIRALPFCSFQATFRADNPALDRLAPPQSVGQYGGIPYPTAEAQARAAQQDEMIARGAEIRRSLRPFA